MPTVSISPELNATRTSTGTVYSSTYCNITYNQFSGVFENSIIRFELPVDFDPLIHQCDSCILRLGGYPIAGNGWILARVGITEQDPLDFATQTVYDPIDDDWLAGYRTINNLENTPPEVPVGDYNFTSSGTDEVLPVAMTTAFQNAMTYGNVDSGYVQFNIALRDNSPVQGEGSSGGYYGPSANIYGVSINIGDTTNPATLTTLEFSYSLIGTPPANANTYLYRSLLGNQ